MIAHERLSIANMVRAPKPKPDPGNAGAFLPNGAAAKAGLNKSIHDAGWGVFLGILAHKAESAGRKLIPVDPPTPPAPAPAKTVRTLLRRTAPRKRNSSASAADTPTTQIAWAR